MSAPIIGLLVALGILYLFGWIAACIWAADPIMDASMGDRPEGWVSNAFGRVAIWLVVTGLPIAVGIALAQASPPPNHGSCKVGHYYTGAKGQQYFACDEYYPVPQVATTP